MNIRELRPISALIYNLWLFAQNGFGQNYYCPISGDELPASKLFRRVKGGGVCYQTESLPFDPDVKWLEMRNSRIFLEISMIDWNRVDELLAKLRVRHPEITRDQKHFCRAGVPTVATVSRQLFGEVRSPRTLLQNKQPLSEEVVEIFILLAEMICDGGAFESSLLASVVGTGGGEASSGMNMLQKQEMQQQMRRLVLQEQRAMMTMARQQWQIARLAYKGKILRMNRAQLAEHIRNL